MSKIVDALGSVRHLGLDTSLFIYFVERNPTYVAVCREVMRLVDSGTVMGYSSVVTLTERLTMPKRFGRTSLEQEYQELLTQSPFLYLGSSREAGGGTDPCAHLVPPIRRGNLKEREHQGKAIPTASPLPLRASAR
jgi:hypothetical protein